MTKQILILGGSRYFGKRLASLLAESHHKVHVMNRGHNHTLDHPNITLIKGDRTKMSDIPEICENEWDIVYDQIGFTGEEAKHLLDAVGPKTKRLVFTSTMSVYDRGSKLNEDQYDPFNYTPNPQNENPYQEGKRQAEALLSKEFGDQLCSVRLPIVLGRDDYTKRLHWHIKKISKGEEIFVPNPEAKISFISSVEAASFLAWVGLHDHALGAINACSQGSIRIERIITMIEAHLKKICHLADEATEENQSPFGVASDWTLDHSKAVASGFHFSRLDDWLPELVKSLH